MGKVIRLSRIIGRGSSWIFAVKLLLSMAAIVFAASLSVTSSSYQAEIGSAVNVTNGLIATDKGFSVSPTAGASNGTSCSSPVSFSASPQTANTTIVAGHLVYDVQVNATPGAPPNKQFNVTLVVGSTTYGPLCIQTLALLSGTIDCRFDVGTALPASPYTFEVTVQ
ncbi:hypothetical protein E6H21_00220 [Candidatus Bathyarchaeota archaeon]|nr:MAG: hypothetical protein E6H21_00220 [Candidatus Bathyarchaeota archaeon]